MKKFIVLLAITLIVVTLPGDLFAQGCAMCKSVAANSDAGKSSTASLNKAIVYLMVVPYLLAGVIAYLWFKNSKKAKQHKMNIADRISSAS